MVWRKGCLCGCLYEEECAYREAPVPPPQVVHVVHHHVHHEAPREPELDWPVIQGEVIDGSSHA